MMSESLRDPVGQTPTIRRSFTLPTKLNPLSQRGSAPPTKLSENVIFYHPSAKIVHFAPRALAPIPSSSAPSDFDYPVDTIESLPWRSATERTVATAPLRLERVHGLTAFLKCGNVVHAILKNSQCWCVDGVSKFVLRIRPLTYYRIEIPHETEEDKGLVGDLKIALPTVLRYEVTPCPFKRAFTVELPEDAMAPRRKRAWRPKERNDIPQKSNSSTSDAVPITDQPPSPLDSIEFPSPPKPLRRSATETPQTFTTLLAKFDAAPVLEECETSEATPMGHEKADTVGQTGPTSIPEVKVELAPQPAIDSQLNTGAAKQAFISAPETQSVAESIAQLELTASTATTELPHSAVPEPQATPTAASEPEAKEEPEVKKEAGIQTTAKDEPELEVNHTEVSAPALEQPEALSADPKHDEAPTTVAAPTLLERETPKMSPVALGFDGKQSISKSPLEPDTAHTSMTAPIMTPGETTEKEPMQVLGTEIVPEHDTTPACVPRTVANAEPISIPIFEQEPEIDTDPDHDSSFSSTPESFHSADPESPSDSVSTHTPSMDMQLPEIHHRKQENDTLTHHKGTLSNPVTHGFAPQVDGSSSRNSPPAADTLVLKPGPLATISSPRNDPPKSSLAVPSTTKSASAFALKASPPTDFNHMSNEFRRRAKATRERDVSPMPPSSALYQPKAGDEASSFISKALTLVLVPPVALFIVLLHVAARIVINPALNATLGESRRGSTSSGKHTVTEDDFSFPLDRESSSEYEDARINRKLDPWDLD
ncbi:hypothetical protein N7533_000924 [Penicillium manginii]|uniref:uncharacterized protein n=1 Tax=Penicillium manginii TaxID=203109 RepID=UPI002547F168|nr:uncharacterized protein N7533_000924 [Penicillium manginii]KAJ5768341.1 hypothetical protein N7533_000924 [Penicillium manginii]